MRNRKLSCIILSAFLAGCLTLSMSGCGGSSDTASGNSTASGDNSDTSSESSVISEKSEESEESSEKSEESKKQSSKEESSEVSVSRTLDPDKDVTITTLYSTQVPYDSKYFSDSFKDDTVTVTTYIIQTDYMDDFSMCNIVRKDGQKDYDMDTGRRLTFKQMYQVTKNKSNSHAAYYGTIVTGGNAVPSDYCFTCKLDDNEYSIPLSDEIKDFPAELLTTKDARPGNIVDLDGEPYFLCGYTDGTASGGSLKGESHHTDYTNKPYVIRRIHADATSRVDISKFSYEPDEYVKGTYDTSKISVTIHDVPDKNNYDKETVQVDFMYEYDNDQYTKDELNDLEKTKEKMAEYGYIVYNGQNGKVRIEI